MYLSSGENFAGCDDFVSSLHKEHFSFSVYLLHFGQLRN